MNNQFPKKARLLNSKQYQFVFDHVEFKVSNKNLLFLSSKNGLDISRLGLVISKKKLKNAVDRNRVKRIARESFRVKQNRLKGLDIIVLARNNLADYDKSELRNIFDRHWVKLIKKYQKENV